MNLFPVILAANFITLVITIVAAIKFRSWMRIISLEGGFEMRLSHLKNESGKIGYIVLWLLGVPASLLLLIFLLRGCT
jgi:hypothetical protein